MGDGVWRWPKRNFGLKIEYQPLDTESYVDFAETERFPCEELFSGFPTPKRATKVGHEPKTNPSGRTSRMMSIMQHETVQLARIIANEPCEIDTCNLVPASTSLEFIAMYIAGLRPQTENGNLLVIVMKYRDSKMTKVILSSTKTPIHHQ